MGTKGKLFIIALLMAGIVGLLLWSKNGDPRKKTGLPTSTAGSGAVEGPGGFTEPGPGANSGESADPLHAPAGLPADDPGMRVELAGGHVPAEPRNATTEPPPSPKPEPAAARTYTVGAGDSLWTIAKKVTGKGSNARAIFEANRDRIQNEDDLLRVGMVLTIPAALGGAHAPAVEVSIPQPAPETGAANPPGNAIPPPPAKTYKVKAGDTLSSIAKELLGDSNKWTTIYKANKDKMSHPDTLTEGMELVIPR
jgi:nucleoid-associated protein YgaU